MTFRRWTGVRFTDDYDGFLLFSPAVEITCSPNMVHIAAERRAAATGTDPKYLHRNVPSDKYRSLEDDVGANTMGVGGKREIVFSDEVTSYRTAQGRNGALSAMLSSSQWTHTRGRWKQEGGVARCTPTSVDASSGDMSPVPNRFSTACNWSGSSPASSSGCTKAASPGCCHEQRIGKLKRKDERVSSQTEHRAHSQTRMATGA